MKVAALVAVALLMLVAPAGAAADDVAERVSHQVMSPFCPGLTLHDCPSQKAVELRSQIERWAAAGWSEARIMNELESEYGPRIRAVPAADGDGLLAWVIPLAVVALGAGIAWTLIRRWARERDEPAAPPLAPADRARVESALAEYRRGT